MKIIIIGGGVAGLSAGIYARRSGFDCEIYEQHTVVGGECTYWKRQGYHIDNCVHWMTGTNPQTELYQVWKDVGVLTDDQEVLQFPSFLQVDAKEGTLNLWQDTERLRADLLALSPDDRKPIEEFIRAIGLYKDFALPARKPIEQMHFWEILNLLRKMRKTGRAHAVYSIMSIRLFAEKFKHPLIRKAIMAYMPKFYNMSSFFYVLGTFSSGNGAIPRGGSATISDKMRDTFLALGGKIFCRKKAERIEAEKRNAVKVTFTDGTEATGDYYVCACDASVTFHKLLGVKFLDDYFRTHFKHHYLHPTYSSFNIYFGVDGDTSFLPDTTWTECDAFYCLGKPFTGFITKNFISEPTYSPEGKNLLQVLVQQYESDYSRWRHLYLNERTAYREEKKRVAESVMARLEERYPQLAGKLTIVETVSPYSFHRFCGAYRGAYMSFILTPYAKRKSHFGRVRGLKNVFLAGQWLQPPGGLPNAVVTGKFAIQRICRKAGVSFAG